MVSGLRRRNAFTHWISEWWFCEPAFIQNSWLAGWQRANFLNIPPDQGKYTSEVIMHLLGKSVSYSPASYK